MEDEAAQKRTMSWPIESLAEVARLTVHLNWYSIQREENMPENIREGVIEDLRRIGAQGSNGSQSDSWALLGMTLHLHAEKDHEIDN